MRIILLGDFRFCRLRAPGGADGRGITGQRDTGDSPRSERSHSAVVCSASATPI